MRVVFMGSPLFAVEILSALCDVHDVRCVYTNPDKVKSRGNVVEPTPVKEFAVERGIEVRTPVSLNDETELAYLENLAPDVICVAASGLMLPQEVLDLPRYGCVNVHGSLLPRWRGAAPIERAILAGDKNCGISIMRMEAGLDTGPFALPTPVVIGEGYAEELTDELARLGAAALIDALNQLERGTLIWTDQDDEHATYAAKLGKTELYWRFEDTAQTALRKVRASSAAHRCKVRLNGKPVDVERAALCSKASTLERGAVALEDGALLVGFEDGVLEVSQIKPEGKASMPAASYTNGVPALRTGVVEWEPLA